MSKKLYTYLAYWGPKRGNRVVNPGWLLQNRMILAEWHKELRNSLDFDALQAPTGEVIVIYQGQVVKTYPDKDALACALTLQGYDLTFWVK